MTVKTASGTKYYIGPQSSADTLSEFQAISGWTEIGEIEDGGQFGDTSNEVTFAAIGNGRVRRSKGARNAGTINLVCGRDPLDAGQDALVAAEATNVNYAFKVVHADALDDTYSDTVEYFLGLVMSKAENVGTNDNIVRRNFAVGINSAIYEDPSVVITSA